MFSLVFPTFSLFLFGFLCLVLFFAASDGRGLVRDGPDVVGNGWDVIGLLLLLLLLLLLRPSIRVRPSVRFTTTLIL